MLPPHWDPLGYVYTLSDSFSYRHEKLSDTLWTATAQEWNSRHTHRTSYQSLPNLRSGVIHFFFCFFGSRGKKNNAWYIHLTSRQPPPNLDNLTSSWPVMLLASQRLPDGNQILAPIMSLLKSILGKRKFLSTSMFRWCFVKKKFYMCIL